MATPDFWKLLAGLGLFLYGMFHLEDTLRELEGRSFKLFLRKHTGTKLKAIFSGTLVTAILQSSSIVNLILLSLVGAGVITMRNALAVLLGSNIGGTFNSWLVALLGFKVNLDDYALSIIGIAGLALVIFRNNKNIYKAARLTMGFGLLFLGLELMKASMETMLIQFDFRPYLKYPRIVFVIIGFVITALVQTSAATVVIVLSALHAGIIPVETAVAVVLGAELGTTIKINVGALGGIASKKRVAFANTIFNLSTSAFGFILLVPITVFIRQFLGFDDPVMVLVAFQTLINVSGAVAFYFFLGLLGDFVENRFSDENQSATAFISKADTQETEVALELLEKEISHFLHRVFDLNLETFDLAALPAKTDQSPAKQANGFFQAGPAYHEKYERVKQAEGEIVSFYLKLGQQNLKQENLLRLNHLMASLRNAMYSAKGMKDISHNRKELSNSGNQYKYETFLALQSQLLRFYGNLNGVFGLEQPKRKQALSDLLSQINTDYEKQLKAAYAHAGKNNIKNKDISTLFNINREIHSSSKAIVMALKDYLLDPGEAERFEEATPPV